jgi:hypothetical protein
VIIATPCSSRNPRIGLGGVEVAKRVEPQSDDPPVDLVADRADVIDGLASGVLQLPVQVAPARQDRAGVAAAHRDDHAGCLDGFGGQRLRELLGQVKAHLVHDRDDCGVDAVGRGGAGRPDEHLPLAW